MAAIGSSTRPVYVGANGDARQCDLDLHDVSVENKGDNDTIAIVTIDGIPYPIKNFKLGGSAFVVDFLDHDRTNLKKEPVLKGGDATPPTDPIWPGHTFTGWNGTYTNVQRDEEVIAVYEDSKYWVLFRNDDGTQFDKRNNVEYGTLLGTLKPSTTPTKASTAAKDFTFKAWNLADTYAIVGNTTVDPTWNETARKYNVTFRYRKYGNGISEYIQIGDVQQVAYGTSASAPAYPTVAGYSRGSRTWDKSYSSITADTVITVEYRKTYDITFKPNGGKLDGKAEDVKRTGIEYLAIMGGVTKPTATKDGSDFSKWTYVSPASKAGMDVNNADQVIDNYVINANYDVVMHTITFYSGKRDGSKGSTILYGPNQVKFGQTPVYGGAETSTLQPDDPEEGKDYTFTGWARESGGTGIVPVTGDENYIAQFTSDISKYDVKFDPNGGMLDGSERIQTKSAVIHGTRLSTLDTYKKYRDGTVEGTYSFAGWAETPDGAIITGDPIITSAKTFYAKWTLTKNTYRVRFFARTSEVPPTMCSVKFVDHDGTEVATKVVTSGVSYDSIAKPNDPTRIGYDFTGWSDPTPPEALNENRQVVDDCEVKAQYTIKTFVVTFKLNGGAIGGSTDDIVYRDTPYGSRVGDLKPTTDPTKSNHIFTGWDKSDDDIITDDTDVNALYKLDVFTVTIDYNGGTINGETQKVIENVPNGTPFKNIRPETNPIKPDCVFSSWSVEDDDPIVGDTTVMANYDGDGFYGFEAATSAPTDKLMMDGTYDVIAIGSGGNGAAASKTNDTTGTFGNVYAAGAGGSGAKFVGTLTLTSPTTLRLSAGTIKIGTRSILSVAGGGNGSASASWLSRSSAGGSGASEASTTYDSAYITKTSGTGGSAGGHGDKMCTYAAESGISVSGGSGHYGRNNTTTYGYGGDASSNYSGNTGGTGSYGYLLLARDCTLTFITNGGTEIAPKTVKWGLTTTRPTTDPVRDGYTFGGWFSDLSCMVAFDFTKKIQKSQNVYAKWTLNNPDWSSDDLFDKLMVGNEVTGPTITDMLTPVLRVISKDGLNKTLTFMCKNVLSKTDGTYILKAYETTQSTTGSNWGNDSTTSLRYYLNNDFLNAITTTAFKNRIVNRVNAYRTGTGDTDVATSSDKVWIPDMYEVGGIYTTSLYALKPGDTNATVFAPYTGINVNTANAIRKITDVKGTARSWWTRSRSNYTAANQQRVAISNTGGNLGQQLVTSVYGVAPCFVLSFA